MVMSSIGAYIAFGGLVFGLLSVILGIIAWIKIRKGVYERSHITLITTAMILGTLGILLGIPFAFIDIGMWLYGIPD